MVDDDEHSVRWSLLPQPGTMGMDEAARQGTRDERTRRSYCSAALSALLGGGIHQRSESSCPPLHALATLNCQARLSPTQRALALLALGALLRPRVGVAAFEVHQYGRLAYGVNRSAPIKRRRVAEAGTSSSAFLRGSARIRGRGLASMGQLERGPFARLHQLPASVRSAC